MEGWVTTTTIVDISFGQNPFKGICIDMVFMTNHSNLAYELITDILAQENILLSVNSGSGICEARVEKGLPFRIREKWATIGDESKPWHIHLNMDEVREARFVKEARTDGKYSYSIRFFDSKGNLSMRANFIKMHDVNGNLIKDKIDRFEEIYKKYGSNDSLMLSLL
jgi:putative heme iron utilization protein